MADFTPNHERWIRETFHNSNSEEVTTPSPRISNLYHRAIFSMIQPLEEFLSLHRTNWIIKKVRLIATTAREMEGSVINHGIQVGPVWSQFEEQQRVNQILGRNPLSDLPVIQDCFSMSIMIWNCRGAGNQVFRNVMRDINNSHRPDVLVLVETKVSFNSMGNFFTNLGLTEKSVVDPVGRSGGIWLLWNPQMVNVRTVQNNSQVINAIIEKPSYEEFILSAVYRSPNPRDREVLWRNLDELAGHTEEAWLVAGDFNDFSNPSEHRSAGGHGNGASNRRRCLRFNENINRCRLLELQSCGPKLTWSNGREGWANTRVKLDRALANTKWCETFPEATISALPRVYSDHCPIIINLEGFIKLNTDGSSKGNPGKGGFGGVFRNDRGEWLLGYHGHLEACTSVVAELEALRNGLSIAKQQGWTQMEVETDAENVINLVRNEAAAHHLRALIEDCKILLHEGDFRIKHTMREGNKCADFMASLGADKEEGLQVLDSPPEDMKLMLLADCMGVSFPRGS